jgi:Uma2 family endonuclease
MIEPTHGGQARISPDGYIEGGTELAAEVAASTASIDLHTKMRIYRRNNVREYIVGRVEDAGIDWFILRGTQYDRLTPGTDRIFRSEMFLGLWLDPEALVHGNLALVLRVLQQGLASPEHASFVSQLRQAATP